jgi:sugar phosphate isomerase/epimerase
VNARRSFLGAAAAVPLAPALAAAQAAGWGVLPPAGSAAPARPRLKLSCNLYSFNEPLRSGALSLERAIEACAELGFDAVDPTGYYFAGYPAAPADAHVHAVKRLAFRCGLAISGTGVRNDFTVPDAAKRQADVEHVGRWLAAAARLGAPCLRVFDGRGEAAGPGRAQMTDWVAEAFRACAKLGEAKGVVIVYQNHNELLRTAAEVLALRERVGSEWFGLNVDIGSLRTAADPYEEIARLAPFACTWQIKQSVYRREAEEPTDLRRLASIVRAAGYRGYLPLETLGPGEPVPRLRAWLDQVREAFA